MTHDALYTAAGLEPSAIVRQLERLLRFRSRVIPPRRVVCLDTFDGRIAAGGGQLWRVGEGATARLEWHPRDRRLSVQTSVRTTAAFVWDLPRGTVATQLRPRVLRERRRFCSHPVRSKFRHFFKVSPKAVSASVARV